MRGSRGVDRGSEPPLIYQKAIGFLSNTGSDPLKITKLPSQHSMLGNYRWWWPAATGLWSSLPSSLKKTFVRVGPPLTKLSGSVHDCPANGVQCEIRNKYDHFLFVCRFNGRRQDEETESHRSHKDEQMWRWRIQWAKREHSKRDTSSDEAFLEIQLPNLGIKT